MPAGHDDGRLTRGPRAGDSVHAIKTDDIGDRPRGQRQTPLPTVSDEVTQVAIGQYTKELRDLTSPRHMFPSTVAKTPVEWWSTSRRHHYLAHRDVSFTLNKVTLPISVRGQRPGGWCCPWLPASASRRAAAADGMTRGRPIGDRRPPADQPYVKLLQSCWRKFVGGFCRIICSWLTSKYSEKYSELISWLDWTMVCLRPRRGLEAANNAGIRGEPRPIMRLLLSWHLNMSKKCVLWRTNEINCVAENWMVQLINSAELVPFSRRFQPIYHFYSYDRRNTERWFSADIF